MKIKLCIVLSMFILSIGCDNYHSRECDAFYYDYNDWQTINEEGTIVFEANTNEEISFILNETYLSGPYTASYIGGNCCDNEPETVVCNMSGIFLYSSTNLGIDLKIDFWQREIFEQPIDGQAIFIEFSFKSERDSIYTPLHEFQIEPGFDLLNSRLSFFDTLSLNNKIYYDVVQSELDTNSIELNNEISYYKLIASRGKGIIYLADQNGKEYYLKE